MPQTVMKAEFLQDPTLPGVDDPYPTYAAMRKEAPAHWCPGPGLWAVLDYAGGTEALRDLTLTREAERDRLTQIYGNSDIYEVQKMDLPYMDGERHRIMRRHVIQAYRAIDFEALGDYIRGFARERFAQAEGLDTFDITELFGADLPVYVVSHLIGVPPEEQQQAADVVGPFVAARGLTQTAEVAQAGSDALKSFEEFFLPLIHARRQQPTGDLTSRLISDPVEGLHLSDQQMLLLLSSNFYAASIFTVRLFVGTLAMAMATHPDVYQRMRSDRSLIPAAVEEVLRWDPPAQAVNSSIVTDDRRYADVTVPAGAPITVLVGAANRDPAQFPDPDAVRLDRNPNRHLAFAPGPHQCLGLQLARLESAVTLEAMADHLPEFGYDESASVRFAGDRFRGYDSLVIQR